MRIMPNLPLFKPYRAENRPAAEPVSPVRFAARRGRQDVLVYSDIDDSLIGWETYNVKPDTAGLNVTRDTLKQHADRVVLALTTSRGLAEMKRAAGYLKGFPVRYLALNNGQQLFVNRQNEEASAWIRKLNLKNEDRQWKAAVNTLSNGWNLNHVMLALQSTLNEEGFRKGPGEPPPFDTLVNRLKTLPGGEILKVSHYPDMPSLVFSLEQRKNENGKNGEMSEAAKACQRQVLDGILGKLQARGMAVSLLQFTHGNKQIHVFAPRSATGPVVSKQTMLTHLLKRMPQIKHVVSIGDNENDTMLPADTFRSVTGHHVPNYPILAGQHPAMLRKVGEHPRLKLVHPGQIASGLEAQLRHIRSLDTLA